MLLAWESIIDLPSHVQSPSCRVSDWVIGGPKEIMVHFLHLLAGISGNSNSVVRLLAGGLDTIGHPFLLPGIPPKSTIILVSVSCSCSDGLQQIIAAARVLFVSSARGGIICSCLMSFGDLSESWIEL